MTKKKPKKKIECECCHQQVERATFFKGHFFCDECRKEIGEGKIEVTTEKGG